jgi:hypothetical protein
MVKWRDWIINTLSRLPCCVRFLQQKIGYVKAIEFLEETSRYRMC